MIEQACLDMEQSKVDYPIKDNTHCYTETKLVAIDECLEQILWISYILEEQRFKVKPAQV